MGKLDLASIKYNKLQPYTRYCKCGHSTLMIKKTKKICTWCGRWIYSSPIEEFKDKLTTAIIKNRKEVLK